MAATGSPTWDRKRKKWRVFVADNSAKGFRYVYFDTRREADDYFYEESGINHFFYPPTPPKADA